MQPPTANDADATTPTRLDIRNKEEVSPAEQAQLKVARLDDIAPIEAWSATGTNRQNGYLTHGIFRYYGKFPPPIASHLIERYTDPDDLVFDPMCGSGTTGVECLLAKRRCQLRDVNPLSMLIGRIKTNTFPVEKLQTELLRCKEAYKPLSSEEYDVKPAGLRNPEHWFLPETADSLRGLHRLVSEIEDETIRDFFWVAFAATVRRVSRATTQQGRLFLDHDSAKPDAWETFERRAKRAIKAVAGLPAGSSDRVSVARHDLREPFDSQWHETAKLVIMHPPYFTNYRYSRVTSLELSWLGHLHSDVRSAEVRECFKQGDPENRFKYIDDMNRAVDHAADLLKPGGTLALMIGDTKLRGDYIPVIRPLLDRRRDDLSVDKVAIRVPRFSEASWVASQRRKEDDLGVSLRDFVIIMTKHRTDKTSSS